MGYLEENLLAGETVLYRTRLHWIVLVGPMTIALVLGLLGAALLYGGATARTDAGGAWGGFAAAGGLLLLIGLGVIGAGVVRRNATEIAVTSRRVLIKTGLVTRRTVEMVPSKIESIGVTEPALGRILGYGSVVLRGTGGTPESFHRIARPLEFRRQVQGLAHGEAAPARPRGPTV